MILYSRPKLSDLYIQLYIPGKEPMPRVNCFKTIPFIAYVAGV